MREVLTTCGELCGAALISIGAFQFSEALGFVCAGALLAGICWLASR